MGFGPDIVEATRQAASVTDRILRGADPADLPVQPAENYLTINLEAAAAIDLTIPRGLLRQADLIVRPGDFEEVSNAEEASS
jgi:putative ABC transport system substrate-binding protein